VWATDVKNTISEEGANDGSRLIGGPEPGETFRELGVFVVV